MLQRFHLGRIFAALLVFLTLALPGCEKNGTTSSADHPLVVPPKAKPEGRIAKSLYGQFCAECHGTYGAGDGSATPLLISRPRDWTRKDAFQGYTDEALRKSVVEGTDMPDGRPKPMPAFGDTLSQEEIQELIAYIRAFAGTTIPEQKR